MRRILLFIALSCVLAVPVSAKNNSRDNEKVKNIILLIGDGMGLGATASWMISNDYNPTSFDRAESIAIVKTYSANNKVTDSAASGTAMACGVKTNNGMIGVTPDATPVESIAEIAKKAGKSVGIAVSSYVQDATPSAFYAHAKDRGDSKTIDECAMSFRPDILVGGGRKNFKRFKENGVDYLQKAINEGFTYVSTPEEFYKTDKTPILGLFSDGSYPMVIDRDSDYLRDVMDHTLEIIETNKKGFFAMIEGSHIDHAAHANNAEQMQFEMEEFDKTVNFAFDYADSHKGTLVIVVADHETGGVYLPSGTKNYLASESGVDVKYGTTGHSASPVVLYAYGASSSEFSGVIENIDIFKKMKSLMFGNK